MKNRIIYMGLVMLALLYACTPDEYEMVDLSFDSSKVKHIEMLATNNVLHANGVNELEMKPEIYDIITREKKRMVITEVGDTITEVYSETDTLLLKYDKISESDIKYYLEDGTEIDNYYSTTEVGDGSFDVYLEIGDIISEPFKINVRPEVDEYEKQVFPVIFHMIGSDLYPTPEVTSADMEKYLERLNRVYTKGLYNASNGGNPNVEFKLAEYDRYGRLLEKKGLHDIESSATGSALKDVIVSHTWDIGKYLNVWVCAYNIGTDLPSTANYEETEEEPYLAGLTIDEVVNDPSEVNTDNPYRVGIVIGSQSNVSMPGVSVSLDDFDWEAYFGRYLGLYETYFMTYEEVEDEEGNYIDNDYCDDTYAYTKSEYGTFYKVSYEGYKYTSENIMDSFKPSGTGVGNSKKSVVSVEQTKRIRWVLENCPSRWAYKSDFAFTGQN